LQRVQVLDSPLIDSSSRGTVQSMSSYSASGSRTSIRLFENKWLERMSHVHPITPLLVWAPVVSAMLYRAFAVDHLRFASILGVGMIALFFWTLTEYLLHRFFFHIEPENGFWKKFFFIIHGNHHEDPQDPTRLVMPPSASIGLAAIFYLLFYVVLGSVWSGPFFAFFILGYLGYDYIHYSVHHFTPRTPIGRSLKQSHMLHHFAMTDARWGVSSPFWDYVFGTSGMPKGPTGKKHAPRQSGSSASH